MNTFFRANGKLLLTAEYAIMFGAEGLAIPLNRFQEMQVAKKKESVPHLYWKAYDINGLWFEAKWLLPDFRIIDTIDTNKASQVINILQTIRKDNPFFINDDFSYVVTHFCNFDVRWGLGSSSTLLVNLSRWAGIDPFKLYFQLFGGSAYDIACAFYNTPIIYSVNKQQPSIRPVSYNPLFLDNFYLLYSGNKRDTGEAIKQVSSFDNATIRQITQLTNAFVEAKDLRTCEKIIEEHEQIIASHLNDKPVKEKYFPDFEGQIKSLGAWGGDFWLVITTISKNRVIEYFRERGYEMIIPFKEFLL